MALLVLGSHLAPGLIPHRVALLLLLPNSHKFSMEPRKGFYLKRIWIYDDVCEQQVSETGFSFGRSHTDSFVTVLIYLHVLRWSCPSLQTLLSHQGWKSVSLVSGAQVFLQSPFCRREIHHQSFGITAVCVTRYMPWPTPLQFHIKSYFRALGWKPTRLVYSSLSFWNPFLDILCFVRHSIFLSELQHRHYLSILVFLNSLQEACRHFGFCIGTNIVCFGGFFVLIIWF